MKIQSLHAGTSILHYLLVHVFSGIKCRLWSFLIGKKKYPNNYNNICLNIFYLSILCNQNNWLLKKTTLNQMFYHHLLHSRHSFSANVFLLSLFVNALFITLLMQNYLEKVLKKETCFKLQVLHHFSFIVC